jgi:phospholipid/cholesterol/gamma-HCH transport system ATP-binding protein
MQMASPDDDDIAVRIEGVNKRFGPKVIYDGLTLSVRRGETLTVLGRSGSGKSVLLRMLIGLMRPDAGRILVGQLDVARAGDDVLGEVRRRNGFLFQGAALFDSMTVGENVAYGLRAGPRPHPDRRKIAARVAECLDAVGLPGIERAYPAELSGGMKKRVALARAIASGPELIVYDEPTTGLDPTNTRRINELIVETQRRLGVTSIVITHDMASAVAVSDRLALLYGGRIAVEVTREEAERAPPPLLERFVRGELGEDDAKEQAA